MIVDLFRNLLLLIIFLNTPLIIIEDIEDLFGVPMHAYVFPSSNPRSGSLPHDDEEMGLMAILESDEEEEKKERPRKKQKIT